MMRQLVCEGRCNGGAVQEFDRAIRAAGRTDVERKGRLVTTSNAPEHVLALGRHLLHTSHLIVGGQMAECLACRNLRKYIS